MKTFKELELIGPLQRALVEEKYFTPTPIQAKTIPTALSGRDVLGCAQTGTGKTAAFALPILNRLGQRRTKATPNQPAALVLAPTRELAIQIGDSFKAYGRHLRLKVAMVYGGVSQRGQVRAVDDGAQILVATPGRLLDLMGQGHILLDKLQIFVLDEADRMMDMGFLPDLKRIIRELPQRRQSLFFSATMPPNIVQLSQQLLSHPVSVNVTPKQSSVERIEQRVHFVERSEKQALLRNILSAPDVDRALVFTRTKRGANVLAQKLTKRGIQSTAIHGNKSQGARQRALEDFRTHRVQVLVATDVAARGIDIDRISHVVNFDMPVEPESYVHRIGRTGRAGAEGIALSFCTADEHPELRAIERLIGIKVPSADGQPDSAVDRSASSSSSQNKSSKKKNRPPRTRAKSKRGAAAVVSKSTSDESTTKRRRRRRSRRRASGTSPSP